MMQVYDGLVQDVAGEFYMIESKQLFPLSRDQSFPPIDKAMVFTIQTQANIAFLK